MSLNRFKENECLLVSDKHCPCIELVLAEPESRLPQRHGFYASQLLHYRLESNDAAEKDAPSEKLTLAFATADVTITGWRLDRIADQLRDGHLLAVRALPGRYANLDKSRSFVASISVEPLNQQLG